jgi:hypothetical protein
MEDFKYDLYKKMFINEIQQFCENSYDPVDVAKKTSSLFKRYQADVDLELRDLMLDIMTMEDGPEFEMSKEEFLTFLDKCKDA